jgi:hypothetical protein
MTGDRKLIIVQPKAAEAQFQPVRATPEARWKYVLCSDVGLSLIL